MRKILTALLVTIMLTACSDDNPVVDVPGNDVVELTLRFPSMEKQPIDSRATVIDGIDDLWIIFYGGGDSFISKMEVAPEQLVDAGNDIYKLTVTVPAGARTVSLVANAADIVALPDADKPMSEVEGQIGEGDAQIMYGETTVEAIKSAVTTVGLVRMVAKTTLKSDVEGFEILEATCCDAASAGTIKSSDISMQNHDDRTEAIARNGCLEWYNYETIYPASSTRRVKIVMRARYEGKEYYYPVAYLKDGYNVELERNHHYTLTVKAVNDGGYDTFDEAYAALPENRVTVDVSDDHSVIYNMIACKDYELGVCEDVVVSWDSEIADVAIVSTYAHGEYEYEIENEQADWVKSHARYSSEDISQNSYHSAGRLYAERFVIAKNEASEDSREVTVTVRSGDLSRTVKIVQLGRDFKRDNTRPVEIKGLEGDGWIDYFDFLDNRLKGADAASTHGVARNEGLHFSAVTNGYEYRIRYLDGDSNPQVSSSAFNVWRDGDWWIVRLNNNAATDQMWVSKFTITTKSGITITYPVYRTGVFHFIDKEAKRDITINNTSRPTYYQQMSEADGWYYYEQVKVKETGEMMLDRNLGATSAAFYSPSISELAGNSGSVGAYYKISLEKPNPVSMDGTTSSAICPAGYTIPQDAAEFSGIMRVKEMRTATGTAYNVYYIPAQMAMENGLTDVEVYIPISGYYEGASFKNMSHACLWTGEFLAGNQGFSNKSPEYKYWYLFVDIYNNTVATSNMRFVNGGAGTSTGAGFKGMPVRCVRK